MNLEQLVKTSRRVVVLPVVGAAARGLARRVPVGTLVRLGVGPRGALMIAAPLAGAFVLGALAGAGVLLFLAPGGAEMRQAISRRIAGLAPQTPSERARASAFASDHDFDHDHDHDGEHEHDEHGRPRRRNHPRA
jgi:hypothetical protein